MSTTAYSVYYQLHSIYGDPLLHRNLGVGHTVLTRKRLVQLMIHCNYNKLFYHRLVFLVALTELLEKFTPQHDIASIINTLFSLSIIDLVLIFSLLLISF
jgi:hypothetical protein